MADPSASEVERRTEDGTGPYDPPRIEMILTAEQLEREVLYAGRASQPDV